MFIITKYTVGYLARKLFREMQFEEADRRNMVFFSKKATTIQAVFRGFYSRNQKTNDQVCHFYDRQKKLNEIKTKNQIQLEEMKRDAEKAKETEKYATESIAQKEFTRIVKNLHHLSSTTTQPGVYNPPNKPKPQAFSQDIEEHLVNTFHVFFRALTHLFLFMLLPFHFYSFILCDFETPEQLQMGSA